MCSVKNIHICLRKLLKSVGNKIIYSYATVCGLCVLYNRLYSHMTRWHTVQKLCFALYRKYNVQSPSFSGRPLWVTPRRKTSAVDFMDIGSDRPCPESCRIAPYLRTSESEPLNNAGPRPKQHLLNTQTVLLLQVLRLSRDSVCAAKRAFYSY